MIDYIEPIFEGLKSLFYDPKIIIMWVVAAILFYFGIVKNKVFRRLSKLISRWPLNRLGKGTYFRFTPLYTDILL